MTTPENADLFQQSNNGLTTQEVTAKMLKTPKVETVAPELIAVPETEIKVQPKSTTSQQMPAQNQISPSERFTAMVIRELKEKAGGIEISNFQRKLIQNYFIKIDSMLKVAEVKRLAKDEKYREPLSYEWKNVDMQKLAYDVIPYSSIGLDPTQANHINPIPYLNKHKKQYDITFIEGYSGIELKAKKFGLDVPDYAIIELVYSNDEFREIKRDMNNQVEQYHFVVTNSFDRGDLVGGFYYFVWKNDPTKNKIKVLSVKDIEKRRPDKASAEFWGGTKDVWENGKKTTVETEGWYEEMCWKTLARSAWGSIIIDSQKIDESYLLQLEKDSFKESKQQEINNTVTKKTTTIVLEPEQQQPAKELPQGPPEWAM